MEEVRRCRSSPATGSRRSIQTFVSNLRRIFGEAIHRHGDGYRLEPGALRLDAAECERLYNQAVAQADVAETVGLLRQSDAIWRGTPFEGIDGHAVLDAEITRLNELRPSNLVRRFVARRRTGR